MIDDDEEDDANAFSTNDNTRNWCSRRQWWETAICVGHDWTCSLPLYL